MKFHINICLSEHYNEVEYLYKAKDKKNYF